MKRIQHSIQYAILTWGANASPRTITYTCQDLISTCFTVPGELGKVLKSLPSDSLNIDFTELQYCLGCKLQEKEPLTVKVSLLAKVKAIGVRYDFLKF